MQLEFQPTKNIGIGTIAGVVLTILLLISNSSASDDIRINAVVRALEKVSPAVVNISSQYEVRQRSSPFSSFGMDPFFDSFFKDFLDPGFERRYQRTSLGSGVVIDGNRGFILTNAHVITKTGKISVFLKDESEFEARIVGADTDSDLAVLKVDTPEKLPDIQMGSSEDLMVGETVIAIGNPFGFSSTVTTGVISALNRSIRTDDHVFHDFIQTDASINPGNSGGPLVNIKGELIGINTAIYAKAQGIGFAIPINKAKKIISDLIRYGEVIQAWLGITVQDIDQKLFNYLNLKDKKGVIVKKIEVGSPSHEAGIQEGDVILSLAERSIYSVDDYQRYLKDFAAHDTIPIKVLRNSGESVIALTAGVFPMERAADLAFQLLGIKVEKISPKKRLKYRLSSSEGVLISKINPQSYLARIGVRSGDIIRQLDDAVTANLDDFYRTIIKYRQKSSMVILLQRGDQGYYITVKL